MTFDFVVPPQVTFTLQTLSKAGWQAFIVGGAVRDLLLKKETSDWDFTTNAKPEEILQLFPEAFYENQFGTVMITHEDLCKQANIKTENRMLNVENGRKKRIIDLARAKKVHESLPTESLEIRNLELRITNYEITTFRSESAYSDFRRPDKVEWGQSIEEDLERRDFTVNALALQMVNDKWQLIDLHGGYEDLQNNILRTVGDANLRFQEDALRMLRAIRFCVQLNMQLEEKTLAAIIKNKDLISKISWERIGAELAKILASNYPAEGIELLDETALLSQLLPEILAGKGVKQGGHHTTDVWTHSLDALRECPSHDPVVRLATLLHDVSKPQTQGQKSSDIRRTADITFYNHEIVGARIASKVARRLRLSKKDTQRVFLLVRYHMFYYQPFMTDAAVRRFMRQVGLENVDDILDLREGDRLGSGARKTSWRLEEFKSRMIEQLNQPMEVKDLQINGHDLMTEFNLKPGPILREILLWLLEKILDKPELNNKADLLKLVKEYVQK